VTEAEDTAFIHEMVDSEKVSFGGRAMSCHSDPKTRRSLRHNCPPCVVQENAEHLMLVDLERNDLGRICQPGALPSIHFSLQMRQRRSSSIRLLSAGTVQWSMWRVESFPHVHHLVSEVQGQLRADCDGLDALEAIFPGGSITGCPKTATIAAIDQLERCSVHRWGFGQEADKDGIAPPPSIF
jgi:hypothetical protein